MKRFTTISVLFLPFILVSQNEGRSRMYCNARFGYCVEYPTFLHPQPESENGDGRVFKNEKGQIVLTVYGTLNQDEEGNPMSLENQYKKDITSHISRHDSIQYKKLTRQFYVISGYRNGKIFYQKTNSKPTSFCFAILEYDKSEKVIYDSVSNSILRSFK